eukprot:754273-Hanusia_phi.AAC.1
MQKSRQQQRQTARDSDRGTWVIFKGWREGERMTEVQTNRRAGTGCEKEGGEKEGREGEKCIPFQSTAVQAMAGIGSAERVVMMSSMQI